MYLEARDDGAELRVLGSWCARHAEAICAAVDGLDLGEGHEVLLDGSGLEELDLTGAWFLRRLEGRFAAAGRAVLWRGQRPQPVEFAESVQAGPPLSLPAPPRAAPLARLGRFTLEQAQEGRDLLEFLGRIVMVLVRLPARPRSLRATSVARHVYETGLLAVPIVALIAFLISVIVAYIGAQELRQFGGDVYVVDLVTVSVLRELGVLLTAIIVAGRSGSAFAAEIGVMQLNDEVDALRAIGLNPTEVLVLPRIIGLVIALPLLAVIADAMGLAGGAVLSWLVLDIPFNQFSVRMQGALASTTFWAGLLKAPVFAFVISATGTYRGMQVRDSSRELGRLTTMAVVQSIFLVLLVDAIFAVIYWEVDF